MSIVQWSIPPLFRVVAGWAVWFLAFQDHFSSFQQKKKGIVESLGLEETSKIIESTVRWQRLTSGLQWREFCGTDPFRTGHTSKILMVFSPVMFAGAAGGRQEALGHSGSLISEWNLLLPLHCTSRSRKPVFLLGTLFSLLLFGLLF